MSASMTSSNEFAMPKSTALIWSQESTLSLSLSLLYEHMQNILLLFLIMRQVTFLKSLVLFLVKADSFGL